MVLEAVVMLTPTYVGVPVSEVVISTGVATSAVTMLPLVTDKSPPLEIFIFPPLVVADSVPPLTVILAPVIIFPPTANVPLVIVTSLFAVMSPPALNGPVPSVVNL